MLGKNKDVGFSFNSADLEKTKYFNLDGTSVIHVDVWVEAFDDKRFWLAHLPNSPKYKFFPKIPDQITAPDGKVSTGCDRLFKMERDGVITLGKAQIFCLDSDDSYLKKFISGFSSQKLERDFVYVTNVYAIDNVFLQSDLLDRVFESVTGTPVASLATKPSGLLAEVSSLVFDVALGLAFYDVVLHSRKARNVFKDKFNRILQSQLKLDCQRALSSCPEFSRISSSFLKLKRSLENLIVSTGKKVEYDRFRADAIGTGYSSSNAYLFVRGHCVYEGLVSSLLKTSLGIRDAEIVRVTALYSDHVHRVQAIKSQWPDFDHALKTSYYAALPVIPFFDLCRSRLLADYA
ncbi:DUF4435 domain-containing protein [Pseudomonas sp. COR58]|uniref:DUF4435 domain-containing protein n=1 Tax=Pseudomonas ekonensis TaxID=2842353 RepID=A0ABS6PG44_9PSED|nr:DUF4435 domain-containing protein [Pseudomonas ekonensis]MBV4459448.1 DUF4435 domain-containing protein [Pseudomonas ekonensis]